MHSFGAWQKDIWHFGFAWRMDGGVQEAVKSMMAIFRHNLWACPHALTFGCHDWHLSDSRGPSAWEPMHGVPPLINKHYYLLAIIMLAKCIYPSPIALLSHYMMMMMVSSGPKIRTSGTCWKVCLCAAHKWGILEIKKKNRARVKPGPTERCRGAV